VVKKLGTGKLAQLNRGVQKFASGGEVLVSPKKDVFGGFFMSPFDTVDSYFNTPASGLEAEISKGNKEALIRRLETLKGVPGWNPDSSSSLLKKFSGLSVKTFGANIGGTKDAVLEGRDGRLHCLDD